MEYSLSDIQLPDPPKQKEPPSETLSKRSKETNLSSKLEKSSSQKEGEITLSSNSTRDESNGLTKKVCDPASPKPHVINEDSENDHQTDAQPIKNDVSDRHEKNSEIEGSKHKIVERSHSAAEESSSVNSKNDTIAEVPISEDNSDSVNNVNATKQSEAGGNSKKKTNSSLSNNNKIKEGRSKPKKRDAVNSSSKEKRSRNVDPGDEPVDKESVKVTSVRKTQRTSRSSHSSSSEGSSCREQGSQHSKNRRKSGSSLEGIASPSSSGSSSGGESEEDKKCVSNEMPKVDSATSCGDGNKRRRKINRNLPVKVFQDNAGIKEAETENTQETSTAHDKVKKEKTEKIDEVAKIKEVREIKFKPRKLSLTSLKSSENSEAKDSEKSNSKFGPKKRKWSNCMAALPRPSVSISSDSLKTLIPDLKPFTVAPVLSDQEDLSNPVDTETLPKKEPKIVNLPAPEEMVHEEISIHTQMERSSNAKMLDLTNVPTRVSPPHNPTSNILFIKNLVRPFTLLQLKELLKQTGNFVEESFWIDKIKSKCIVAYETEEQAVTTRTVLHGTRWPLSNPKILSVDFSTEEELDAHRNMTELPKPVKTIPIASFEKQEVKEAQTIDVPKRKPREEHKRDKDRQKLPVTHVREWDKDKISQDSPDQASHRVEKEAEKPRSDKRKEKKDSKRRVDDDAPAKLLDDLFRKTRASPCIYWLPLTEEQAKQREEERQARRVEREKRWQQRKEQEENERRNRTKGHSGREKENRRSQSRSRSPQGRRR